MPTIKRPSWLHRPHGGGKSGDALAPTSQPGISSHSPKADAQREPAGVTKQSTEAKLLSCHLQRSTQHAGTGYRKIHPPPTSSHPLVLDDVQAICGKLVTIDHAQKTLQLAGVSVQEYLESKRSNSATASIPGFSKADVHASAAFICLKHLISGSNKDFLAYSDYAWGEHARIAREKRLEGDLHRVLRRFLFGLQDHPVVRTQKYRHWKQRLLEKEDANSLPWDLLPHHNVTTTMWNNLPLEHQGETYGFLRATNNLFLTVCYYDLDEHLQQALENELNSEDTPAAKAFKLRKYALIRACEHDDVPLFKAAMLVKSDIPVARKRWLQLASEFQSQKVVQCIRKSSTP